MVEIAFKNANWPEFDLQRSEYLRFSRQASLVYKLVTIKELGKTNEQLLT